MRAWEWIGVLTIFALCGAACGLALGGSGQLSLTPLQELDSADLSPGEKLRVVVTTSILGDVVANIAGQDIELQVLTPAGRDPHSYQPTPQDLTTIAQAHVVFINGLGLEIFLEDTLANASGQVPVVSLSEGITARTVDLVIAESDPGHAQQSGGVDAHVWLDPNNVLRWVDNAQTALATLDPGNAARYSSAASDYKQTLEGLHAWILEQVAQVPEPHRMLVTDHLALTYFADRYGFAIVGAVIPAYSTTAEVSAQELVALQQAILGSGVRAIFVSADTNPAISQQLASDLGLELVPLYLGSLSDAGGPASSYFDLMQYNVEAIVAALLD